MLVQGQYLNPSPTGLEALHHRVGARVEKTSIKVAVFSYV